MYVDILPKGVYKAGGYMGMWQLNRVKNKRKRNDKLMQQLTFWYIPIAVSVGFAPARVAYRPRLTRSAFRITMETLRHIQINDSWN